MSGSKNVVRFLVVSAGVGSPTDGRSQGIQSLWWMVVSDASPCDFCREYNRHGPPIAFTKKAMSLEILCNT